MNGQSQPSPSPSLCQHVCIAHSRAGDVAICPDCGVVHVSLQYMTLRFDRPGFTALQQLLNTAAHELQKHMPKTDVAGDAAGGVGLAPDLPSRADLLH